MFFAGTGTSIGDPTEVNSLGNFFSQYHRHNKSVPPVLIGSVKTNIGHTESAAGVAGLIKVLLMMKHGRIVPSLHVKKDKSNLNPKIDLDKYGFDIALDVTYWESNKEGDRISCVNSFGFGGSNSHAIIIQKENYASAQASRRDLYLVSTDNAVKSTKEFGLNNTVQLNFIHEKGSLSKGFKDLHVVCLSAAEKRGLQYSLESFLEEIKRSDYKTVDIAYTSSCHRDHFGYRIGMVVKNNHDLIEQCTKAQNRIEEVKPTKSRRLVFVYCGVGTTWKGMCNELMRTEPVFKGSIEEIDKHLQNFTTFSVGKAFMTDTEYDDPFINHIAIFSVQAGLTELWKSWGVFPDMVVGQSVGEVAAAYTSGSLSLKSAVEVIYYRSKILAEQTGGAMMVVGNYDVEKLKELCKVYKQKVVVAVHSSPTACTLSGDKDVMKEIRTKLEKEAESDCFKILLKELPVKCAYHSGHVENCTAAIKNSLSMLSGQNFSIPHISTVTGELASQVTFKTRDYWADNVRKPVLFMQSIRAASRPETTNIFLEIGPKPVLRAHLSSFLDHKTNILLPSIGYQKECSVIYDSLVKLYEIGHNIEWDKFYTAEACLLPVPKYKFNKSKMLYFSEPQKRYFKGMPREESVGQHMFLRSGISETARYKLMIDRKTTPYVYDHFLHNTVLVPGATYVEAAFEIGHRSSVCTAFNIVVSVEFINPLTPTADNAYEVEMETDMSGMDSPISFTATKNHRIFAEGTINKRTTPVKTAIDIEEIKQMCTRKLTKVESYRCLEDFGFKYGESLSLIRKSWSSKSECLVEIALPDSVKSQIRSTHLHPAIIDAVFQTFGILSIKGAEDTVDSEFEQGPTLPKGVGAFVLNGPPHDKMYVYAKETKKTKSGNHYNALLLATNGVVIAEVNDFYTRTVTISTSPKDQDLIYELTWKKVHLRRQDDCKHESATTFVLTENRFISFIKESGPKLDYRFLDLQDDVSNAASVFCTSSSDIDKESISAILFAPLMTMRNKDKDGMTIFAKVKKSLTALKDLIICLNNKGICAPLIVLTECIHKVHGSKRMDINVYGSELWGLVRSAIREVAYNDIRIIDMDFSEPSFNILQELLLDKLMTYTEYVIDSGDLYTSKLISYPQKKLEKSLRDITRDSTEQTFLMSANQSRLESPHFRLADCTTDTIVDQRDSMAQVQLTEFCLHDRSIYPVTCGQSEGIHSLWPEINERGFQMLAVEGMGFIAASEANKRKSGFSDSESVLFCSPCKVASVVSIPKECIVKASWLPGYRPGILTSSVLLWNLIESQVEFASTVCIICDNSTSCLAKMASDMVGKHKGCFGVVINKENICNEIAEKNGQLQFARSVVLLSKLNICQVQLILSEIKTIDTVVTTQDFIPRDLYRQIVNVFMFDVKVQILETEGMFLQSSLKKKVPKIVKWLRSLNNDFWSDIKIVQPSAKGNIGYRQKSLSFPYETFCLYDDTKSLKVIKNSLRNLKTHAMNVPLRVTKSNLFRQNGVYIIVGGLTGLGWELLNLMAEMGAGYLVTFSRREPNETQKKDIHDVMFRYDCNILCMQTDITDFQALKQSFSDLQHNLGSIPLRGVLQGGGVLADSLLTNMTNEQMERPLLPKILGSWNLHLLTKDVPLDFFIMHSSIVSVFGNKGQCNYGSGNAFMDTLAHYRRTLGLCGQSINWGALGVGMAVQDPNVEMSLNLQGIMLLYRYDIRTCFLYALMTNEPQITFGNFNWGKMASFGPYPSNLTSLIDHGMHIHKPGTVSSSKDVLNLHEFKLLNDEQKYQKMFEIVIGIVCEVFVVDKDSLDSTTTFISLGVDSMAGMTFVNVAFDRTQCRLPIVTLLSDQTTLGTVTEYLIDNLNYDSVDEFRTDSSQKLIYGKLPFMQQFLLEEYVQDPDNPCWVRMADLEIKGIRISIRSWRAILSHVLKINPELRRLYKLDSDEGDFDSYIVSEEDAKVDLERVTFECMKKNVSELDIRQGQTFDLRTQFPIRFQVAAEGECSILRIIVHSVATDINSISIIFQDIAVTTEKYAKRKRLPENKPLVDINAVIQNTLKPRLDDLAAFWKAVFAPDIQPVSFCHPLESPDDSYFLKMEQTVPQFITDLVLTFVQKNGITLFQYIVSIYQLLLYQNNARDYIPVCTPINMRMHAPEIRRVITRGTNVCPLVADFTGCPSVKDFILKNSQKIQEATEHSAYPFQMIQEQMGTDKLRNNITRHSLVMDNNTDLNSYRKHDQVKINIRNVWHSRTKYEFFATFKFDQKINKLVVEYGFNSKICGLKDGALIPNKLIMLMERCVIQDFAHVSDGKLHITDDDLGETVSTVLAKLPNRTVKKRDQQSGKEQIGQEKRPSLTQQLKSLSVNSDYCRDTKVSGITNMDKGPSETQQKDISPKPYEHWSFTQYIRKLSKGSCEENQINSLHDFQSIQVIGEMYKKKEEPVNSKVHLNLIHTEPNEKSPGKEYVGLDKLVDKSDNEHRSDRTNDSQTAETTKIGSIKTAGIKNELMKRVPSKIDVSDRQVHENCNEDKDQDIFTLKTGNLSHTV